MAFSTTNQIPTSQQTPKNVTKIVVLNAPFRGPVSKRCLGMGTRAHGAGTAGLPTTTPPQTRPTDARHPNKKPYPTLGLFSAKCQRTGKECAVSWHMRPWGPPGGREWGDRGETFLM